jgi:hypothetical protein
LLAAIFFPVATLSAVFDMKLPHGLETWQAPWLFWGILAGGLVVGLWLALLIARKPALKIESTPKPHARESNKLAGRITFNQAVSESPC